jgi:hypothetical protein
MKKGRKERFSGLILTDDNVSNMKQLIGQYKNVLVCGMVGVGKIINTVSALQEHTNVFYIGNPVDYEGKQRPGSYDKYLSYIISLKQDLKVVDSIEDLFSVTDNIFLIIDEIYGRSKKQFEQIGRLFDMQNIRCIQIVGCMKYMKQLINKIDIIVVLETNGAFTIDREFGKAVCKILGRK